MMKEFCHCESPVPARHRTRTLNSRPSLRGASATRQSTGSWKGHRPWRSSVEQASSMEWCSLAANALSCEVYIERLAGLLEGRISRRQGYVQAHGEFKVG